MATASIRVVLGAELRDKLESLAADNHVSLSTAARVLIARYFDSLEARPGSLSDIYSDR